MVISMIDCRDLLEGSPNTRCITKCLSLCFIVFAWRGGAETLEKLGKSVEGKEGSLRN